MIHQSQHLHLAAFHRPAYKETKHGIITNLGWVLLQDPTIQNLSQELEKRGNIKKAATAASVVVAASAI